MVMPTPVEDLHIQKENFFKPNLSLKNEAEALEYYQKKLSEISRLGITSEEEKEKLTVITVVEFFSLQKKVKGDIFESELSKFVENNFLDVYLHDTDISIIKALIDNNVDANITDFYISRWNFQELAKHVVSNERLTANYKRLFSKGNADKENVTYAKSFLKLEESLVLARGENGRSLTLQQMQDLLKSDVRNEFLHSAFLNFDIFSEASKQDFRQAISAIKPTELANVCIGIIEDNNTISSIIFEYLDNTDSYLQSRIIELLIKNNLFTFAKPMIPRGWKVEYFISSLFSNKTNREQTQLAYEFVGELLQTEEQKLNALRTYLFSKGFTAFLADAQFWQLVDTGKTLPTEWFRHFFEGIKYAGKDVGEIPKEFADRFPLNEGLTLEDILSTGVIYLESFSFPEPWREKISVMEMGKYQAQRLLREIASGHSERVKSLGGQMLLDRALGYDLSDWEMSSVLDTAIEFGWSNASEKLKEKIVNTQWTYFPESLFATNDIRVISAVAAKSKISINSVLEHNFTQDTEWFKALFANCSNVDVQNALYSEVFQVVYPEFVTYAQELIALGEKALVVRCAARGMSLEDVKKLIDLARVQPHILYETTAVLTGLHKANVYWEERKDQTVEGLFWDQELKQYLNQDQLEPMTAKELVDFIVTRSDPSSYESVFFLLDLAKEGKVLKESEEVTEEDYKYIFRYLSGRDKADIDLLSELGTLAGYKSPADYEEALVEVIDGYPYATQIDNIVKLSKGEINAQKFKEISYRYLNTDVRFSADTCLVLFEHAEKLGDPFTREEKRRFWDTFTGDFEKKHNIFTLSASEVQIFLDQDVIDTSEARQLLKKYILSGSPRQNEILKLFVLCINNKEEFEELLSEYIASEKNLSLTVLVPLHDHSQERGYTSEKISDAFAQYLREDSIDFQGLMYYLNIFELYVTEQQVKDKVIFIAQQKKTIMSNFVELAQKYRFTLQESRLICQSGLEDHNVSLEAFKLLYELAEYSQSESEQQLVSSLENATSPINHQFLEFLCERVDVDFVYSTAVSYTLTYRSLNNIHLNTLKNFLGKSEGKLDQFESEIRQKDARVAFFDNSELADKQWNAEYSAVNFREIFIGLDPIDLESEQQNLEENKIFLVNSLIFGENRGVFSQTTIRDILGDQLYENLTALKENTARKVSDENNNWMIERERAFNHFVVMGHGTWQAHARKEGVARSEEEKLDSRAVVDAIVTGPDGVGIRGEKATLGAFTNPGTRSHYGEVEDGSLVMFFLDDLIQSHVTIATDPMGADGYVGIDHESKKYVQIPNRALFNPQAGTISGVELTHVQMADYLLEFRHIVESNEAIGSAVFEKVADYLSEKQPQALIVLRDIHRHMRADSYPESAILWARDYYLRMLLSDKKSDQLLAGTIEKVVRGLSTGALEGDLRSYIDTIRLNWDSELEDLAGKPLAFMKLIIRAQEKMKSRQRQQFSTATRQLRQNGSREKVGVAKQHILQVRAAERYGDVAERNLRENLKTTRAIFMDSEDETEYIESLEEVKKYADYMQSVKESVLLRTFQRGVDTLDQVNAAFYRKYADKISVCSSGSIGRGEVVISSDVDYLVLLDDRDLSEEDITQIKRVLFKVGETMNKIMEEEFKIRPDAGLANKDRQPIVMFSKVANFTLDSSGTRQVLEPTEMFDVTSVDGKNELLNQFKRQFAQRAQEIQSEELQSISLHEYLINDLKKYEKLFLGGFSQLLSRDQLIDFKMQVQRIFNFYIYSLVAEHISEVSRGDEIVPNKTLDKIQYLADKGYIVEEVAARLYELQLMLYRMRYRTDVLNSAQMIELSKAKGGFLDERAKIQSKLDPQKISAEEYSRFLDLITFFSQNVQPVLKA